jgi:hypothetical protein
MSKKDIPCLISLVTNQDNLNNFALVFITKKNKKIDTMLPITAELHIQDLDVLNFVCFWDPRSYNGLTPASIGNAVFKIRITCNHAQEKKNFLEKF